MSTRKEFMRKALAAAGILAVTGYASAATAEETVRAGDVYVTATRVEQELQDVPMSVSVMTDTDVRRSGARTVGELLQDVPGVTILDSGGQGMKRVSIRGEDPSRVLILVDGQKIVENKSMDGTPVLLDPSRIERVEVIKGPASVLYGSEAIGGVVNIITKKGGDKPVQAEVGAYYNGATNGFGENLSLYGGMNGFKYRVSGAYTDQGKLRTPMGDAPHTGFNQTDLSAFLSYDWEKLTVGGGYDFFHSDIDAGSQEEGYENFFVKIRKWDRQKFYAFAEFKDVTGWLPRVRLDAFTQRNHKDMHNHVDTDGMPMLLDNLADNLNEQWGASLQADWLIGDNHYLITGYELSLDKLDADTDQIATSTPDRVAAATGMPLSVVSMRWDRTFKDSFNYTQTSQHKGNMLTNAVFAQMESTLPWDFTLSYGVRYTWVRSKMDTARAEKTVASGLVSWPEVGEEGSTNDSRPVFNVGLVWQGVPDLALRVSFAQGFRVPSLQEKYVLSAMGGGTILPNPNLKPETSNNYEFGARYTPGNWSFDGAFFLSDADDYIYRQVVNAAEDISRNANVASARTYGAELAAAYNFDCGLTPYVSGTYLRRKYEYGGFNATLNTDGTWQTGNPLLSGRLGLRFERAFSEEVNFFADVYGRFGTAIKTLTTDDAGNPSTLRYPNWGTANVAFGFDFGKERQYTVMAEVLNLFDRDYRLSDSLHEPGLHANIRLALRF